TCFFGPTSSTSVLSAIVPLAPRVSCPDRRQPVTCTFTLESQVLRMRGWRPPASGPDIAAARAPVLAKFSAVASCRARSFSNGTEHAEGRTDPHGAHWLSAGGAR